MSTYQKTNNSLTSPKFERKSRMDQSRKSFKSKENKDQDQLNKSATSIQNPQKSFVSDGNNSVQKRNKDGTRIQSLQQSQIVHEQPQQYEGLAAFLEKIRLLDLFKVSIYPRKFKDQSFFGSIGGFICTILFIGYLTFIIIIFLSAINKPINMDWDYQRPYNVGLTNVVEDEQSLYYTFENDPNVILDGNTTQLYLKIDNVVEETRPVVGGIKQSFTDVIDPAGCTNTDGWCDYSFYTKRKISVADMQTKDYEFTLDVQIWDDIETLKKKLIEGGQEGEVISSKKVPIFQSSVATNVGFIAENTGQQNLIPIFNKENMDFKLKNGQIMLISLMSQNTWLDDAAYALGFSVELVYKKHFYDRFSNKQLNIENFRNGVQSIEGQEKIWVKLGLGQNFRSVYPDTDVPPYKANPMHFENLRVTTFGIKQYFMDGSKIPWAKSDETQIAETIHIEEFNNLKFQNSQKFLNQHDTQPEWAKTGQFNLDIQKATLAQYWVYWSGEKENVYVKFPSTDYYVLNIMTLLMFTIPFFSCIGLSMNKCCLYRELNQLYKGNKEYLKLDPLELSNSYIYTNYKNQEGELLAHVDLVNAVATGTVISQNKVQSSRRSNKDRSQYNGDNNRSNVDNNKNEDNENPNENLVVE